MASTTSFVGLGAKSSGSWQKLEKIEFEPKQFEDHDVDIRVQYCGVCGSDIHTLSGGWPDLVEAYNFKYRDGSRSYGGYANYIRVDERFVFPVPEDIPPEEVAPLFCAGLTVFSPLKAQGVNSKSRVGIVGLGGLGHYAVSFASALGAKVTVISHSPSKKEDALELGATGFICTTVSDWASAHARSFDVILCTSFALDLPVPEYLSLLDVGGTLVYVGIPEHDLAALPPGLMIGNNSALRGSNTGSRKDVLEMLELVKSKRTRSWVSVHTMSQASEVVQKQAKGEARYRFVLRMDQSLM
ncbi:hypothetical protein LTR42_002787 [Elasticomyces elasticus]|nr:hypothetical protein LTR42_002787 [Elasticomyces elasticus]